MGAFKEAVVKTLREFYKKDFDASDVRTSITAAIAVRVQEPVFESQTKTKLGSTEIAPGGQGIRSFINENLMKVLDNYLHKKSGNCRCIIKRNSAE